MPYIGKTTDGFGVRNRFVYLATSGATSVSGADANGATLTFTDGAYVDVYLNGVLLKPTTDYNTSTANTIAGLSALNTNDEVTVVVYDVFTVADMVSATSGGTFVGNVNFSGNIDVDGTTNLDAVDIDGALTQDGGAVFNEDSADVDFRVESNGNANMLFVDGGNDALAIGSTVSNPYSFSGTTNPVAINATGTNQGSQLSIASTGTGTVAINLGNDSIRRGGIFALDGSHLTFATNPSNSGTSTTEGMRIDSNGIVTMPLQPAFMASSNSNNNHVFSSADSYEQIITNVETIDKNSDYASSTFTAPVDGTYFISGAVMHNASSSGVVSYDLAVYVNSSLTLYARDGNDNYTITRMHAVNGLVDLDANDTVKLYARVGDVKSRLYFSLTTLKFQGYLVA